MSLLIPENLKISRKMPTKLPKVKSMTVSKTVPEIKDKLPIASQIVVTEFGGPSPFEHLELLSSEVFLPVLSNPLNQQRWGGEAKRGAKGGWSEATAKASHASPSYIINNE